MHVIRFSSSLILGVIVAFALFILMSALISMNDEAEIGKKGIKIQDFSMPDTDIKENLEEELPDKPDDVEAPPPDVESQDIEFDAPDSGLNLASGGGDFKPDIGNDGGFARDTDLIPIYVPEPRYPPRAQKSGKSGYAVVRVTVTEIGTATDVELLEEWPESFGFGRAAAKAAEKLKYNARVVNGVAVPVPGVLYKFSFNIETGKKRR